MTAGPATMTAEEMLELADRMENHVVSRLPGSEPVVQNGAWQMMLDAAAALHLAAQADVRAATIDPVRVAIAHAIDLLTERTYGNPARSPGHNARLVLERALSDAKQPALSEESSK